MVKVNIISGFLGAGKTTLIKKLLTGSVAKEKIILLENEYGEVGVDGSFMKDSGIIVDELNSGCICCTLVGDFQKAVDDLIAKYHPDRLLIEPSGVGKLSEILAAVERAKERHSDLVVTGCATVVDAGKCRMYMKNFGEFFLDQIKTGATVIFSRTQLLSAERIEKSRALVEEQHPGVRIVTTQWDDLSADTLLEVIESGKPMEIHLDDDDDDDDEDEHEHHHHHHDHDDHDHEDEDADDHGHHHAGEANAHIWLDAQNAIQMVDNLADGLISAMPQYEAQIEQNRADYVARLAALDAELKATLAAVPNKNIVTFHEAFPYFARAYGLTVAAVVNHEPGDALSPAQLAELVRTIRELNNPPLFTEPQYDDMAAQTISRETGAPIYTLDPVVTGPETDVPLTYYEDRMRENMQTLLVALTPAEGKGEEWTRR